MILRRVFLTLFMLAIYRLGTYIPVPANSNAIGSLFKSNTNSGIFSMLDLLSGGGLMRNSIFSLNIMPYIVASIMVQLLLTGSENDDSKFSRSFLVRATTAILSLVQAILLTYSSAALKDAYIHLKIITVISLLLGVFSLMWIGEFITTNGIGNGISLLVFSGIVAELPPFFVNNIRLLKTGALPGELFMSGLLGVFLIILLVVLVESSYRKIPIFYPRKMVGNKMNTAETSTYMPLKANISGVMPPIFANAILMLPVTLLSASYASGSKFGFLLRFLSPGRLIYNLLYAILIYVFCFFYSTVAFDADKNATNLHKAGGLLVGKRPGKETRESLRKITSRITFIGATYICFVCLLMEIVRIFCFSSFVLSGTSILILVGAVTEIVSQIQLMLHSQSYSKFISKSGLRKRHYS